MICKTWPQMNTDLHRYENFMLHIAKPMIAAFLTVALAQGQVSFERHGDERRNFFLLERG